MAIAKQMTATVIPALQYQDAPAAVDFLCKAFGFGKKAVYEGEGGSIAHAELTLGNGMVMLGSVKDTDYGRLLVRPREVGGVTMSTYRIADPDAHCARAKAAGAEITRAPVTQDYGGRDYTCKDPEGNVWTFGGVLFKPIDTLAQRKDTHSSCADWGSVSAEFGIPLAPRRCRDGSP